MADSLKYWANTVYIRPTSSVLWRFSPRARRTSLPHAPYGRSQEPIVAPHKTGGLGLTGGVVWSEMTAPPPPLPHPPPHTPPNPSQWSGEILGGRWMDPNMAGRRRGGRRSCRDRGDSSCEKKREKHCPPRTALVSSKLKKIFTVCIEEWQLE